MTSWVVGRLLFGDTDVTQLVSSWGGYREAVSDSFEIIDPSIEVHLVDYDMELFDSIHLSPDRIPVYLYNEEQEVLFKGLIDPVRVSWDSGSKNTKLTIPSIFSEAKTKVVTPEYWQRPPAAYTVAVTQNLAEDRSAQIEFEVVADLYPGDVITYTFVDEENSTEEVIERTVRAAFPEYGRVVLTETLGRNPVQGDVWTRKNNELRYVLLPKAVALLNQDLASFTPEPVLIDAQIENVLFDDYATFPFPVPRRENEACSVYLQCRYDADRVAAVYCDQELAIFGTEIDATFSAWDNNGPNIAKWPADWVRDRATAPSTLLNPPFLHPFPEDSPRPRNRDQDGDEGSSGPVLKRTVIDYNNLKAYMLQRNVGDSWRMNSITRVGTGWGAETELFAVESSANQIYAGLGLDHVTNELYSVRKNATNAILVKWDLAGNETQLATIEEAPGTGTTNMLSVDRKFIWSNRPGTTVYIWDITTASLSVVYGSDRRIYAHSAIMFDGSLYAGSSDSNGTYLHRWTFEEGAWKEKLVDRLVDFPNPSPVITKTSDTLWIGLAGQIWIHSKTYRPMIDRADVEGMTVGKVCQNMMFLADAYLYSDRKNTLFFRPKPATFEHVGEADCTSFSENARSTEYYQRVIVTGRNDIEGTATTGLPGDEWSVQGQFIETQSHALAVARQLLNYAKHSRRELSGVTLNENAEGLKRISHRGADWLIKNASWPLIQRGSLFKVSFDALEVVGND